MKKLVIAALVCAMVLSFSAIAEESKPEAIKLECDVPVEIDLDGDGTNETVTYSMTTTEDSYEPIVNVIIVNAAGESYTDVTEVYWGEYVFICDIDSDGKCELLVSGDVMSDDYYTWCYHYDGKSLTALEFADANRGENTGEYEECGYGLIMSIDNGKLTLSGSQDVLGTRFATRVFTLTGDRFELEDGGMWIFPIDLESEDAWEDYSCLTVKAAIPCVFTDEGTETEGEIAIGEKLVITMSDKVSKAYFMTQSGKNGYFAISANPEKGWGLLVNGIDEEEVFDFIPYAD